MKLFLNWPEEINRERSSKEKAISGIIFWSLWICCTLFGIWLMDIIWPIKWLTYLFGFIYVGLIVSIFSPGWKIMQDKANELAYELTKDKLTRNQRRNRI